MLFSMLARMRISVPDRPGSLGRLASAIGQYRAARRQLDSSMRFLASDESSQISAARLELSKRPDDAMALLVEASADATKPKLVQRALAIMVQLDRPKLSIPAMVAVLYAAVRPELHRAAARSVLAHLTAMVDGGRIRASGNRATLRGTFHPVVVPHSE